MNRVSTVWPVGWDPRRVALALVRSGVYACGASLVVAFYAYHSRKQRFINIKELMTPKVRG